MIIFSKITDKINQYKLEFKELKATLKDRWKAESPKFWIDIKKLMIKIGTAAAAIILLDKTFDLASYGVQSTIFTVCSYIIVACGAIGVSAQITKQ